MTIDEQKSLARRSLEMWARTSTDRPEDVFAAMYENHQEPDAKCGVSTLDLDGWKALVQEVRDAFPDLEVRILTQIAEGDLVATRWKFTGAQSGDYLGRPPSGRRATWSGVQIDRFEHGKIVESWVDWDKYRMLDELGFLG